MNGKMYCLQYWAQCSTVCLHLKFHHVTVFRRKSSYRDMPEKLSLGTLRISVWPRVNLCPIVRWLAHFFQLRNSRPWSVRFTVMMSASELSSIEMTFIIYLCVIFSSSRKASTNQQTVRLSSCVARSFPCVVCAMPLVPGPTFRQWFPTGKRK